MTDDLIAFARAQLDEDEQMLRALDSTALNGIDSTAGWGARDYIERGLAEVDAKRRILDIHATGSDPCDAHDASLRSIPCDTVLLLAAPFADRPGYREEWRP